jgi:cysteine desulfurase / selenocysteine lyase
MPGGGTVDLVLDDEIIWTQSPDRHEGGTPNVAGAVALAAALRWLDLAGREEAERREMRLFERLVDGLREVERVRMLGPQTPDERVGVVSFAIEGWSPAALATALNAEHGIAVRHGCFCAHPYFFDLMGLQAGPFVEAIRNGASTSGPGVPGAVRASLGVYNTQDEVDALLLAAQDLAKRKGDSGYRWVPESERWVPA